MSITRAILNWSDKKFEESMDLNDKHRLAKAAASGLVEGLVDGAIIAYPMLCIACTYWKNQALKK